MESPQKNLVLCTNEELEAALALGPAIQIDASTDMPDAMLVMILNACKDQRLGITAVSYTGEGKSKKYTEFTLSWLMYRLEEIFYDNLYTRKEASRSGAALLERLLTKVAKEYLGVTNVDFRGIAYTSLQPMVGMPKEEKLKVIKKIVNIHCHETVMSEVSFYEKDFVSQADRNLWGQKDKDKIT